MFAYILIVALIPAMALATNVGQCEGKPFPNAVRVANCSTVPCNIVRGTDAVMDMDFTVGATAVTDLTPQIKAYALGLVVDYPLSEDLNDVCSHLGTSQCPLDPTEEATWNFVFSVGMEYPLIDLVIEVTLVDQSNNTVSCFQLAANVVDA